MNISRTGIFCEAVKNSSFTKTAESLGYSQSAVSQNIKTLERELGFTLVDRRRDGICLTADGREFMPYLQAIYTAEQALWQKQREMRGLKSGVIRIGTFTSASRNFLIDPMESFKEKYPDVRFILRQGDHVSIPDWIREGSVDLGFVNADLVDDLQLLDLYQDDFYAVLPQGHPLANQKILTLEDLAKEKLIILDEGKPYIALKAFERAGLSPLPDYEVYDDYTVLEMVRQGLGVSLMYGHFISAFHDLVEVRPLKERPGRKIALAWRNTETLPYAARQFIRQIKTALGKTALGSEMPEKPAEKKSREK